MKGLKAPWWRYVLATVVFIVMYLFSAPIIGVLLSLTNIFVPIYLRNDSPVWPWFIAYIFAVEINSSVALSISKNSHVFAAVLDFIAGGYSLFVAVWNYTHGITTLGMMFCVIVGGISYCGMGIYYIMDVKRAKSKTVSSETTNTGG